MSGKASVERLHESSWDPAVDGFLHRPAGALADAMVLTHGAGSDCSAPLLVAMAEALADAGWLVLRCNLPFRQCRPRVPPSMGDPARDREGLRNAVAVVKQLGATRVFMGGHSYGGRQASMLAASEPGLVAGLLLLSYPLHPPRKPQQLRTQHLPSLKTPALFVSGTRDPFGSVEELEAARKLIPAPTSLIRIEGAGHDLVVRKKLPEKIFLENILSQFVTLSS